MGKKYNQMTRYERMKIEAYLEAGLNGRQIAQKLNRNPSTIYKEIKRGRTTRLNSKNWKDEVIYSSDLGDIKHTEAKKRCGAKKKIQDDKRFIKFVEKKIVKEHYSPAAVLYTIQSKNLSFRTDVCLTTLYNYIKAGVFANITMVDCPNRKSGKKKKKKKIQVQKRLSKGTGIDERPDDIDTRDEFGHWEMDSVIGKKKEGKKAIIVLTERKTRMEIVRLVKNHTSTEVLRVLNKLERDFGEKNFRQIFKTITVDNGTEFSDWAGMEKSRRNKHIPRTKIYYCHAYRSWERGSNENQNKMIRRWHPKGTSFDELTQADLSKIETWMNDYPRKMFNGKSALCMVQQEYPWRVAM